MSLLIAVVLLLAGPAAAPPSPAQSLSGTWKGTAIWTKTGDCPVDPTPRDVRMEWTVEDSGTILIEAVKENDRTVGETWQGQLGKDLQVTLVRSRTMTCDRDEDTSAARFSGPIENDDGTYHLEMEADVTWCPEQKCTARVSYQISKPSKP